MQLIWMAPDTLNDENVSVLSVAKDILENKVIIVLISAEDF